MGGGKADMKQIDPGTGLTLEELIDAFITKPREAKELKAYLTRNIAEESEGRRETQDRAGGAHDEGGVAGTVPARGRQQGGVRDG
jgi:hypothetical protein